MGKIRILSRESRPFRSREEAARLLARELAPLKNEHAVVLGIPRGGLVVARELARALDADLDVALARKLGAPGNPELAIGAVAEDGAVFLNELISSRSGAFSTYIEQEKARQMTVIARRGAEYRRIIPRVPLQERYVIITDDGIATGATMQAALWVARREHPRYLMVAVPVAPADSIEKLAKDADEVFCLHAPPYFSGVGQFYEKFSQVEDAEVLHILREEADRKVPK